MTTRWHWVLVLMVALGGAVGCDKGNGAGDSAGSGAATSDDNQTPAPEGTPATDESAGTPTTSADPFDVVSHDILAREPVASYTIVQHVLISWDALATSFRGAQDPRGAARSRGAAADLARSIMTRAQDGERFAELMAEYSEDPGSAESGTPYDVTEDAALVPSFKDLGLRLSVGELGICESNFGFHIMTRVEPDPAASIDILSRTTPAARVMVQHILISSRDNSMVYMLRGGQDERGAARTIDDARTEVGQILARISGGDDFELLMREFSEDRGSAQTGRAYEIVPEAQLAPGFKVLGLRLEVGEVGVAPTEFGFHIMRRTE